MATFTQADDVSANVPAPGPGRKTFWYDNALEQWRFKDETGAEFPLGGGATPLLELPKGSLTGADVGKFATVDHGAAAVTDWQNLSLPAFAVQETTLSQWEEGLPQIQAATVGFVLNGVPGVLPGEGDTLELYHPFLPGFFAPLTFTATVTDPASQVVIAPDIPAQLAAIAAFFAAPGHIWEDAAVFSDGSSAGDVITFTLTLRDIHPETTGAAGLWWQAVFTSPAGSPGTAYFQGGQDATDADRIIFTDAVGGIPLEIVAGVDIPANPDLASVTNTIVTMVQGATDIRAHNYTPGTSRVLFKHFTPGTAGNASVVEHRYGYQPGGYYNSDLAAFAYGHDLLPMPQAPCLGRIVAVGAATALLDNGAVFAEPCGPGLAAAEALFPYGLMGFPAWAQHGGAGVDCPVEFLIFLSTGGEAVHAAEKRRLVQAMAGSFLNSPPPGGTAFVSRTAWASFGN